MRETKPFTCHICRRKTDELLFCPGCKAEVCFRCIWGKEAQVDYALGEWRCKRCAAKNNVREK